MASVRHASGFIGVLALLATVNHGGAQEEPNAGINVANQFNITLPEGWNMYDQNAVVFGRTDGIGIVIFSAEPLTKQGDSTRAAADLELMAKVDTGEIASFFVDRQPAGKNDTCAKPSRSTVYNIGTRIVKDPVVGAARRYFAAMAPRHTDIEVDECRGVRFVVDGRKDDPQNHWIVDVRAMSDGEFLYLFSLRNRAHYYAQNLPAFESALATVRFMQ